MSTSPLCSLSTVSSGGRAHINHMYFAFTDRFEVVWISERDSIHSRNLARNSTAAVTIYDSHQTWGQQDRGIQLFETAGEASGRAAADVHRSYGRRLRDSDA